MRFARLVLAPFAVALAFVACVNPEEEPDDPGHGIEVDPRAFNEYVLVELDGIEGERTVLVDGIPRGKTGDLIEVERGVRTISLEGEMDFAPDEVQLKVERTTFVAPARVEFSPAATDGTP